MKESSNGQELLSCSDVEQFLAKQISEEPLNREERQALPLHLQQCRECHDFELLTSNLSLFPGSLSDNELEASILDVMEKARDQRRFSWGRTLGWAGVAIAASIALIALIGLLRPKSFLVVPEDSAMALRCVPETPSELAPGVFMTYCGGLAPETAVEKSGEVRVVLHSGTVGLSIDPERPNKQRVIVEAPQGEVQVKGTVFAVHVDEKDAWVEVFRGVVEVVPTDSDVVTYDVAAGHGAELRNGNTFVMTSPRSDVLRRELIASAMRQPILREADGHTAESFSSETDSVSSEDDFDASVASDDTSQNNDITEKSHRSSGASRRISGAMYGFIQQAESCMLQRDWRCAAEQYREVLTRFPRRPESMSVLISLAKLELRYLGAPKDALTHYQAYQRKAPNGPLAEEALYGTAEAYRRLGRPEEEAKNLRRFIAQYAESSLVHKARARLKMLER